MADSRDKITRLFDMAEDMVDGRQVFNRVMQQIREYVRINTMDFTGGPGAGQVRSRQVFDSTAIHANKELASGLCSHMVNPSDRWFTLAIVGMEQHEIDEDGLAWLEIVSDIIYSCYGAEVSGFNTTMHECMLDIGSFGMSCPYQYFDDYVGHLSFRAMSMASVYFRENSMGRIDTTMVKRNWTVRQLAQEFTVPEKVAKKKDTDVVCVSHIVFPRDDRDATRIDAKNKRFASAWLVDDTKEMLDEGGYDSMPYHGARWMKLADEVYGSGPAKDCLPDILLLNKMERTLVVAAEKRTDPPLMVPDEGFVLPLKTAPGSLMMYSQDAGENRVEPLQMGGDIQWSLELANEKRESIKKGFHSDWLRLEKQNQEMTAFEVADRRNEKLSLLSPMIGRVQGEQLNPLVARSYHLLKARNYFPPAPPSLQRRKLEIKYLSPAARAQLAVKANEIGRYLSEVIPLIQVYPGIVDAIDFDKLAKKLAEYRSMTRSILRTDAQIAAIRAQRQEQERMQAMVEAAEPVSKALKNVADAQSKGLNLGAMNPEAIPA